MAFTTVVFPEPEPPAIPIINISVKNDLKLQFSQFHEDLQIVSALAALQFP